jgi:hypothetical protein
LDKSGANTLKNQQHKMRMVSPVGLEPTTT